MRVHQQWRRDALVSASAFTNHNAGMSTDWEKYASPEDSRRRARDPAKNAVVSMVAGQARAVPGQHVEHTPDPETDNRAHTDVFGEKDEEARAKLRRIAEIVIPFEASVT